jgi:hypothetical protein
MIPVLIKERTLTLGLLLVASFWGVVPSCAPVQQASREPEMAVMGSTATAEAKFWEEGMHKFKAGDYEDALIDFDVLRGMTQDDRYLQMASYASACTRLILAENSEEFVEAMKQWAVWSEKRGPEHTEDPRMLWPLLQRIALSGALLTMEAETPKPAKPPKRPSYKVELVSRDLAAYKSLAQSKEKESERLKSRLESKEREIRRLKQQIESLEAIHLKFQERQKEISSP